MQCVVCYAEGSLGLVAMVTLLHALGTSWEGFFLSRTGEGTT
jgi:hypothetical protein